MNKYRLWIEFPSGTELSTTVDFYGLKEWILKENHGYRIITCNGYYW